MKEVIELLEAGDWQAAHAIVQTDSSVHGSWAHGIVHIMEGDLRKRRVLVRTRWPSVARR